jgi:hypothetical protein
VKEALFFVNKKKQKNFYFLGVAVTPCEIPQLAEIFGSFFKKNALLA